MTDWCCKNCRWYRQIPEFQSVKVDGMGPDQVAGGCHLNPPVFIPQAKPPYEAMFGLTVTTENNFCSHYLEVPHEQRR